MASRHSPTHLVEGARDTAQCQRASRPQDMCLGTQRRLRGRSGLGPGTAVGRLAHSLANRHSLAKLWHSFNFPGKNEAELWRSCASASSIPSPSSPHEGSSADCWRPSLSYFPLIQVILEARLTVVIRAHVLTLTHFGCPGAGVDTLKLGVNTGVSTALRRGVNALLTQPRVARRRRA